MFGLPVGSYLRHPVVVLTVFVHAKNAADV